MTEEKTNSIEFLQKFTYRPYEGEFEPRWKRVLYLIRFELVSTWRKSKFGKILLILLLLTNFFGIVIGSVMLSLADNSMIRDGLNQFIANYLSLPFDSNITSSPIENEMAMTISMNIGILVIMVVALAGSGLFADDKRGHVTEIYLSRLEKREYITGKVGAILLYINLLILVPLTISGVLFVQSLGENHLDYLGFYMGIIGYSLLVSLFFSILILTFSIFVERRSYASLLFFLFFIIASILGSFIQYSAPDNELLLMISPSNLLILLAYVCLGDFNLGLWRFNENQGEMRIVELNLNDGAGLEYFHILIIVFMYILICSLLLAFKIWRTTTEE